MFYRGLRIDIAKNNSCEHLSSMLDMLSAVIVVATRGAVLTKQVGER